MPEPYQQCHSTGECKYYQYCVLIVSRASNDLLQLGGGPSVVVTATLQPSYFQPSGIVGPAAGAPALMSPAGVMSSSIPFQSTSFTSQIPPTQPFVAAVPPAQQTFPSAAQQAPVGSYPSTVSSAASYPLAASYQPVPRQAAVTTSAQTTCAATSQTSVSRRITCNCLICFVYYLLALL